VLKWARANGCPWDGGTCAQAAKGGHLEVLRWAREHDCPWDDGTCEFAAEGGHLEVLQWAREHGMGLHSSTFWLNLSAFCAIGGSFRRGLGVV